MTSFRSKALIVATGLLLGGCSTVADSLWPSSSGGGGGFRLEIPASQAEKDAAGVLQPEPVLVGSGTVAAVNISDGSTTGTAVGQKVAGLRGDLRVLTGRLQENDGRLQALRAQTLQTAQTYHGIVAAMSAKLQVGTTPGNPNLTAQWAQAAASLEQLSQNIGQMNRLAADGAANSSTAAFILDTARAVRGLSGAVDEDHRQLSVLEDETNRTVVQVDRLLSEVTNDLQRQTAYVGTERAHLTVLNNSIKVGQLYGAGLGTMSYGPPSTSMAGSASAAASGKRPLVVIRFDRDDVAYRDQLYAALTQAVERKPDAGFEVVSVAPASGTPAQLQLSQNRARQSAQNVVRAMSDMGMPAARIRMSSITSDEVNGNEVQIFVK